MKRTTLFKILTLLYIAAVAVLCFANFSSLPTAPRKILGIDADKVVHFLMFFPFPLLAYLSFPFHKRGLVPTFFIILLIFAIGCGLAGVTEYVQSKLPYRTMDENDFKADLLALLCSSIITFFVWLFLHKRKDA